MSNLLDMATKALELPPVVALIIALFIYVFSWLKKHTDTLRAEKSSKISEMIAEINKATTQPKYHYVVEQLFLNRYGFLIDYPIIKFFLRQKTPSYDITRFIKGYSYIEFDQEYSKPEYKKSYTKRKLKLQRHACLVMYFITAFIGLGLIAILPKTNINGETSLAMHLLLTLSLLSAAFIFLNNTLRMEAAVNLVEKYQHYDKC